MLADTAQLQRWRQLLDSPGEPADAAASRHTLATATGRPLLVAAVGAAVASDVAGRPVDGPPRWTLRPPSRLPAAEGLVVAADVWLAYVDSLNGDAAAEAWLRQMIDALAPTALVFTADDNPEPWWQAEMIILHALHSFALRSRDRDLVDKTLACADFHLREIQPDHATNEPWAVHAYASHFDGNVTAETLWHAAYIQHGGAPGPVARLLAREASASLAMWLGR